MGQFILPLRQSCHSRMVQLLQLESGIPAVLSCNEGNLYWLKTYPRFRSWSCLHQGWWQNCWRIQMKTKVKCHWSLQECYNWFERQPREWVHFWIHCHGNYLKEAVLPGLPPYDFTWSHSFAYRIQLDWGQTQIPCSFHLPTSLCLGSTLVCVSSEEFHHKYS